MIARLSEKFCIINYMKKIFVLLGIIFPVILDAQDFGIWMRGDTAGFTPRFALASAVIGDPVYNSWSSGAPMPTPRSNLTASVVNGKIYAIGGTDTSEGWSNKVEVYDPEKSKTWTKLGTAGWFHPVANMSASVIGENIYII